METTRELVEQRINELRYQKVHLRPFIASDQALSRELDRAISELQWVLTVFDSSTTESNKTK